MDNLLSAPTSHGIWNVQLVQDDLQIQIVPVAICLAIFGAHINILFIIKVMTLVLIEVVIQVLPNYVD